MKQLLQRINGWRFEAPLALILGAAAGFAAMAMPSPLFGQVPVLGDLGDTGQMALAALVALLAAVIGYGAMRMTGKPAIVAQPEQDVDLDFDFSEEPREPVSVDRLRRVRRADAHPDAPPRAPIIASRDLGEPFMEVGTPLAMPKPAPLMTIPDGDFVEVAHADMPEEMAPEDAVPAEVTPIVSILDEGVEWSDPVPAQATEPFAADTEAGDARLNSAPLDAIADPAGAEEPEVEPLAGAASIEAEEAETPEAAPAPAGSPVPIAIAPVAAAPSPVAPSPVAAVAPSRSAPVSISRTHVAPIRPARESLAAMMDRLSAGLERRATAQAATPAPATMAERDMRPALRDALEELNRIASARHG